MRTTLWLTALLGGVFTIVGMCSTGMMLRLLGMPEDVFSVVRVYLMTYFPGISDLVLYNMCAGDPAGSGRFQAAPLCAGIFLGIEHL